ncbi:MAG: T9SS type A sorting domain-containing protein, partial [Flavobacterium sp.]
NLQTQNFCITASGVHNDVEVSLIPVQNARPGFDAHYRLVYKNKGNQVVSGSVNLSFDDSVLDFATANPAIASQSTNQLQWNFSNLLPFEKRTIDLTLNVNSPQETPAVNNGDVLNFSASIPLEGDEMQADNTAALAQTVLGSFDPNDKICLEGATMTPQMVGDYLHYVIRFQNSGTYQAENIVVKDVIDTDKFDISTLELTSSSHPQTTRISGNTAEFIFNGINLPTEASDEPASHGFIAFKIKTKPTLTLNQVVENTADIYFDFNFPIVTNTASTTVSALGLGTFENTSVSMAPNPVKSILNISAKDTINSVQVYDVQGRLLQTSIESQTAASIDFTSKTAGVYFVKVATGKGTKVQKIIKQ